MDLKDRKVSVIGLGRSGIAAANFLVKRGARVTLCDRKPAEALTEALAQVTGPVELRAGTSAPAPDTDLVVLSPGVDLDGPDLADARARGVEIIGEMELAARFTETPLIAVTGTNGKSTTSTLIAALLAQAGRSVLLGGNIGVPFVSLLDSGPADWMVLEVSSFQMEAVNRFHPRIAVILNLTPDHLDRHRTLERYGALKRRVAENQTSGDDLIVNGDDPGVVALARGLAARTLTFSTRQSVAAGACLDGGNIVLRRDGRETAVCALAALPRALQWQLENVLPAVLAADLAGAGIEALVAGLQAFRPLEHRLEWVRNVAGIDFINDSKGTNVGAVEKSLSCMDRPVVLIMGGQDKGTDFRPLLPVLRQKVKHMILIGEARDKIKDVLNGSFGHEEAESLPEAVRKAYARAAAGDAVLLSPGCASFDMFRDYADRGRQFKHWVLQLGVSETPESAM